MASDVRQFPQRRRHLMQSKPHAAGMVDDLAGHANEADPLLLGAYARDFLDPEALGLRQLFYEEHAVHPAYLGLGGRGAESMNWQTMDSAPRDGTPILVWGDGACGAAVVRYEGESRTRPWFFLNHADALSEDGLTHWMALPSPPPSAREQ